MGDKRAKKPTPAGFGTTLIEAEKEVDQEKEEEEAKRDFLIQWLI